ncbi:MAG: radical SAM protein [Candidatus Bathyarchaeota archaeon]|nr:radical SAM protein [Candidatus Bathyarchaeota archaeon A05DMB-3]MDH7607292.1 radical SAM protein [Candidatus Bathyarchaeota archaeon]
MPYDPVKRHIAIEKLVTRIGSEGQEKKYYRIRPARWYGGIITADCVGCGLLCRFCWVSDTVMRRPADVGDFFTSKKVAEGLTSLAKKCKLDLLRVSGGEPTIGKQHLLALLENLQGTGYRFILETNGIPLAYDEGYTESLAKYNFVHVRVSLKGCNEKEFALLTGAKPEGFKLQLKALQKLVDAKVSCHPAVMASFSTKKSLQSLLQRIRQISPKLADEVEIEELILYPHVVRRLRSYKLKYYMGYAPERVPPEQV